MAISLVIMAAGIGSRFGGGIKQLEPVGPHGELLMEYSVHDAIEAFIAQDLEAAMEIIKRDDEVDTLFNQVKTDVIDLLKTSPSQADQGIDLLMVAKYLERIGDHAVNVCEWTQFSKTGALKNVRIM